MAAWKSIRITKPYKLSIKSDNLIVANEEESFRLSLSDTDSIIFEGNNFTLTAHVLTALAKHKVATLFCDKYYMPQAILLPYRQVALGVEVIKAQIVWSKEFKSELWQLIIEAKILNQSAVLEYFEADFKYLGRYINCVALNDKYNETTAQ